jgi:hypothetical protein
MQLRELVSRKYRPSADHVVAPCGCVRALAQQRLPKRGHCTRLARGSSVRCYEVPLAAAAAAPTATAPPLDGGGMRGVRVLSAGAALLAPAGRAEAKVGAKATIAAAAKMQNDVRNMCLSP